MNPLIAFLVSRAGGPNPKSIEGVGRADVDGIDRDKYPQHVEKHKINPKIHEVAAVQVDIASEPFRAERHEA